jgi:hypothetical protein
LVVPPPHESAHAPWEQTSPAPQETPHFPQFAGSFWTSAQAPPQSSCDGVQPAGPVDVESPVEAVELTPPVPVVPMFSEEHPTAMIAVISPTRANHLSA